MKKFLYITGCILAIAVSAQQPFINSLGKTSGTANEVVTISGSGFSTSPTVYFGNGKVTSFVGTPTDELILANVPATATYGSVTVVNNTSGLSATSSQLFSLSFDNDFAGGTFSPPTPETPIATGDTFAYDLCLCDFDGDDLLDAIVTHDGGTNLAVELNNDLGIPGTFTHSLRAMEDNNSTHYIECGDLNADGEPDLVVTSSGAEPFIHIYQNSSATFTRVTKIRVPQSDANGTRSLKRVRLADIDGDGKPDIIAGNFFTGDNDFFVYLNTSSGGTLSFNTTENLITVAGASNTASLFPGDLNNDDKVDLAFVPNGVSAQIYLMKNTSLPGSVSFESIGGIGSTTSRWDLTIADFNNDGLNDIASTQNDGTNSQLQVAQNEGDFVFLGSQVVTGITPAQLVGIAIGDMNGDGFADIVSGSLNGDIAYMENTTPSSGSDVEFEASILTTSAGSTARNVRIGDLNDDGKPDIAFTNNSKTDKPGEMGYILNDGCMTPVIVPDETPDPIYCNGDDFILRATAGHNVTYNWTISGEASQNTGAVNELNLSPYNTDKTVSVTVTQTGCSVASSSTTYDIGFGSVAVPSIDDPGLVCLSDNLTLTTPATPTNYLWTGPNGFTSTLPSPTITNVSSATSGTYTLVVDDGDCLSPEGTRLITISGPPVTAIEVISCADGTVSLSVPDLITQFSYQWKQDGGNVGTNSAAFTATTPGSYTLDITDANTCTYTSDPVVVYASSFTGAQSATHPTLPFFSETEVCVGVQADFTADQTGTSVTWEVVDPDPLVEDTLSFTGNTLSYTFAVAGTATVSVFTSYADGIGCSSKTITISADPAFTITPSALTKCSSESVTLTLTGASAGAGDTWTWDDDDPTTDLSAEISNVLSTSAAATYSATYTSGTGCQTTTSTVTIADFPGIGVTATESTIVNDTIIFAEEQTSVTLTADNSSGYIWTADSRDEDVDKSNANTAIVIVTPSAPIVTVTVTGTTLDGCAESTNIVIMSGSLTARQSFSPNGDGLNDFWTINNSRNLSGCKVYVFDSRGANIFKEDSPFANDEVWDGNFKNKPAPEGVYYFVLKCDDSTQNQTGAILLAR
ncbi:MAG: T9SS type B sorting domain-containing protein [Cytophagales bacterium]|nr:T9SS type B sorting domain-containing protein [Cytophagales bacterium]